MVKTNDIKKIEALKLRETGDTIKQIVTKTGLSKSTLIKHFKKHGVIKSIVTPPAIKNDTPENKDESDDKKVNLTIKEDVGVSETGTEITQSDTFKGSKVSYDKGNISIESSGIEDIVGSLPTTIAKDTPELEPVPGSYTKPRENMPKQDLDVDRPEDPLDNFFGRGMVETLIPIGLIIAGYVMKKENDPTTNQFKGEEIRSKGLGWLSGDRGGDNW